MSDSGKAAAAERGGGRGFAWAAVSLAALHAILGLLLYEPTLFTGGDNAGYLILGEALRTGQGYRDLYLPGAPLHAKYPPVFPGLLAVLGAVGGVQFLKLAMLAFTSAVVWLTARLGRALAGEGVALVAAGLLAVNPTLLDYSHYLLSEGPFLFFVSLSLWSATREGRGWQVAAVGAAVAAFGTRTAGLTLLLALPAAWALAGRRRQAMVAAAAGVAVMLAWGVYQKLAAPTQAGYLHELVLRDPYDPAAGSVGAPELVARAAANLWAYASDVVPRTLWGDAGDIAGPGLLLGLALCLVALLGWARRAAPRPGPAEMFALLYAGLIAIWPEVWTDRRFLLPLVPLLWIYAMSFLSGLPGASRRWVPIGALALVGLPSLAWIVERVPQRIECVASFRSGSPCDPPAWASFYEAARWAGSNTPPDAIIANRKPRLFYWVSRRRGDLYPYSGNPEAVLRGLERMGASFVVVDRISGTTVRYLVPAIQAHPLRFQPAWEGGSPPTFLFRFLPEGENAQ